MVPTPPESEFDPTTEAIAGLREFSPRLGIVAGSGLGRLVELLELVGEARFQDIPGLPKSSVSGHDGRLVWGNMSGFPVVLALGRVHLYEGHPPATVTAMIRLMAGCGIERLLLTNAAGSLHPDFIPGQWMLIRDHLNLTASSPLTGPQFVDLTHAYDPGLADSLIMSADALDIPLHRGTYACLRGPQYETPAEIHMLRTIGARAIGMSTVLETIQARALGLRVAGLSCLTNWAAGIGDGSLSHDEVIETGATAVADGLRLVETTVRAWTRED